MSAPPRSRRREPDDVRNAVVDANVGFVPRPRAGYSDVIL